MYTSPELRGEIIAERRARRIFLGKIQARKHSLKKNQLKFRCLEYKGGKCERCGYFKCAKAMHFHHIDPTSKEFAISQMGLDWDKIKIELDKCMLLCANCHAEEHEK